MNARSLKFTVLGIFLSLAIAGFFVSGDNIAAQKKKSDVIEKAAAYKTWKQPVKPTKDKSLEHLQVTRVPGTLSIGDSSGFG